MWKNNVSIWRLKELCSIISLEEEVEKCVIFEISIKYHSAFAGSASLELSGIEEMTLRRRNMKPWYMISYRVGGNGRCAFLAAPSYIKYGVSWHCRGLCCTWRHVVTRSHFMTATCRVAWHHNDAYGICSVWFHMYFLWRTNVSRVAT